MLLQRMSPLPGVGQLRREMDRLFTDFLPEMDGGFLRAQVFPALNVWEDGDRFFVEAEVPGLKMENVDVQVLGNELTIKGHREVPEDENVVYHRRERGTGEFVRTISLPAEIDTAKVEAVLKDGVMTVTLPKAEIAKARKIMVKSKD